MEKDRVRPETPRRPDEEKGRRRPFVRPVLVRHELLNQVARFGAGGVAGVETVPFVS